MADVLIIKLSALGDLVQADGAMRDIREHHRGDRLTVMTIPAYQRYMERCPWVDRVFVDPRAPRFHFPEMLKLRSRLRNHDFARVYDLQQVGRTRFYHRYLFPRGWWMGDAPGCTVYLRRPDQGCAADHFQAHLRKAGVEARHCCSADVSWMAEDVDELLAEHKLQSGYVLLIPGASAGHDTKRWPHFGRLAGRLLECGRQPVTVPGPGETDQCRAMRGTMLVPKDGYHDYFILAGVARRAAYVVGNDTGPTHIAAHLGCRGLALYGSHTPPLTTGIQHSRFNWLQAPQLEGLSFETVWGSVAAELGIN